jgi:hypothetical protein
MLGQSGVEKDFALYAALATGIERERFLSRTTWLGFVFTAGRNLLFQWSCSFLGCDVSSASVVPLL